ncbi:MAG: ABC transporter permease, partial [Bacillota bacterium]|nr:ABC transporter permease [Bacillota bacterium]
MKIGLITLEKRAAPSPIMAVMVPVVSVFMALLVGAIFLKITGREPLPIYFEMFSRAFGTRYGLSETIVKSIPLMLAGLGVAVAFRMQLWNIGGEGQLFMGAFAATWVALSFPDQAAYLLLPLMFFAGCAGGAVWGLL